MRKKQRGGYLSIWLCTAVCLAVFLFAPTPVRAALAPAVDLQSLEKDAQQTVTDLLGGDFATVREKFDENMADTLSEEDLKSGLEAAQSAMPGDKAGSGENAHLGHVSLQGSQVGEYYVFGDVEEFAQGYLLIQITYDAQGQIAGLFLRPLETKQPETSQMSLREDADYKEEEATVQADERYPLKAVLTLPKNVEQPPAVILVHGSGSSNFDEQINENKPFADLAEGLARRGIAVLRYNKRAFQYPDSTAHLERVNLREETLDDVDAAIALLEAEKRVDREKIVVLGHSFGGSLLPAIAAEHPQLAGVISMAGSLRPLWEISYDQNQEAIAALEAGELSEEQQGALAEQKEQIEEQMAVLRGQLAEQADEEMLLGVPAGYWKSVQEYAGMNFIEQISLPMLILQGEADFQVYADVDYALWQETLADRQNVTFHLYQGLNHLFMPTNGQRDLSEYATPSHVEEQVIADIAEFVSRLGK